MLFTDNNNENEVSAIGAGLIDFLIYADDAFISSLGVEKGGMSFVDEYVIESILAEKQFDPVVVPGGSACNTVVGIAQLGGAAKFICKLGSDNIGDFFKKALLLRDVEPHLFRSELPTGKVLSIITPDMQRTMLTHMGASSEILLHEITPECFQRSKIVHIEGYLLFNSELMFSILESARSSGAIISLDLASFTIVKDSIDILNDLIPKYVDILIGNEDEAEVYTSLKNKMAALEAMAKNVSVAVLKLGSKGSYVMCNGNVFNISPFSIEKVVDTTGAGDLWASGFLFGLLRGMSLEKCGEIASVCGGEVCKVVGANIPKNIWNRINEKVHQF